MPWAAPHRAPPRPGRPPASSGIGLRLGSGPRLGPARALPRAAHAASPASGRRPTTRERQRRAFSSWIAGSGGGGGGDSQLLKRRDPGISKSPSGARSGRHALTAARRDATEKRHAPRRVAGQPGGLLGCAPPTRKARDRSLGVSAREGGGWGDSFRHHATEGGGCGNLRASAWESGAPPPEPRGKMAFPLDLANRTRSARLEIVQATYRASSPALLQPSLSTRDEDLWHGRSQKTEHLFTVNGSVANLSLRDHVTVVKCCPVYLNCDLKIGSPGKY